MSVSSDVQHRCRCPRIDGVDPHTTARACTVAATTLDVMAAADPGEDATPQQRASLWLHRAEQMATSKRLDAAEMATAFASIAAVWQQRAELEFYERSRHQDLMALTADLDAAGMSID